MKKLFGWVLALGLLAAPLALTQRAEAQDGDPGYYSQDYGSDYPPAYASGPAYAYGPAPVCPYGYYGYYPYSCAPYGFYRPSWVIGGGFFSPPAWGHGSL